MEPHQFPYIETTLANYFGVNVGYSETEAIAKLRSHLSNDSFRVGLRDELVSAFADTNVSWREILSFYEVAYVSTEQEAVSIVRRYLWVPAFSVGQA
jgi:hypothetical protein